jgi:hypothetical protein
MIIDIPRVNSTNKILLISICLINFIVKSWNYSENQKEKSERALPECTILHHKAFKSFKANLRKY